MWLVDLPLPEMISTNRNPRADAFITKRTSSGWACATVIPCRSNVASGRSLPRFIFENARASICGACFCVVVGTAVAGRALDPMTKGLMGGIGAGVLGFGLVAGALGTNAADAAGANGVAVSATFFQSLRSSSVVLRGIYSPANIFAAKPRGTKTTIRPESRTKPASNPAAGPVP